jgi:hypothetical protein
MILTIREQPALFELTHIPSGERTMNPSELGLQ